MAKSPGKSASDKRKARLAGALRENLKRRKAQARARAEAEGDEAGTDRDAGPGQSCAKT